MSVEDVGCFIEGRDPVVGGVEVWVRGISRVEAKLDCELDAVVTRGLSRSATARVTKEVISLILFFSGCSSWR